MDGRKPKPVEQRRREGNPGKRRLPEPVLVGGRGLPQKPRDLPAEAKSFWDQIVSRLAEVGLIDLVDRPALVLMSIQWARAEQARREIEEKGLFATGSEGQIVEHPAVKIERAAAALYLRFAEHYALTPVARTRLGLAELQRKSIASELDDRLGRNPRG